MGKQYNHMEALPVKVAVIGVMRSGTKMIGQLINQMLRNHSDPPYLATDAGCWFLDAG